MTQLASYRASQKLQYQLHVLEDGRTYQLFQNEHGLDYCQGVQLPVSALLPWANYDSLLFRLCQSLLTAAHLRDVIERLKERTNLYLDYSIPRQVMAEAFPALFKEQDAPLEEVFTHLNHPAYYQLLTFNEWTQNYNWIVISRTKLGQHVPLGQWRQLYELACEHCPSDLSLDAIRDWESLRNQNVKDLVRYFALTQSVLLEKEKCSNIQRLLPAKEEELSTINAAIIPLLTELLSGIPLAIALQSYSD